MRVLQHLACCGAVFFFALSAFGEIASAREEGLSAAGGSKDGKEEGMNNEQVVTTGDWDGQNSGHHPGEVYFAMDDFVTGEPFSHYGLEQHHLGRTTRPLEGA